MLQADEDADVEQDDEAEGGEEVSVNAENRPLDLNQEVKIRIFLLNSEFP